MRIDGEIDLINPSVSSCQATGLRVNRAAAGPLLGFAGGPRPAEQSGLSAEVTRQSGSGGSAWWDALLQEQAVTLSACLHTLLPPPPTTSGSALI